VDTSTKFPNEEGPQTPGQRFTKYRQNLADAAVRTVAERERRAQTEHDDTIYHQQAEITEGT
jgi:hypothetical protein